MDDSDYTTAGPSEAGDTESESSLALFCRALYHYKAHDASGLSFRRDDIIEILMQEPSGWWDGYLKGQRGWFPSNYVTVITEEDADLALLSDATSSLGSLEDRIDEADGIWMDGDKNQRDTDNDMDNPSDYWVPKVTQDGQVCWSISRPLGTHDLHTDIFRELVYSSTFSRSPPT
jgi:son of sevenless-like protein